MVMSLGIGLSMKAAVDLDIFVIMLALAGMWLPCLMYTMSTLDPVDVVMRLSVIL